MVCARLRRVRRYTCSKPGSSSVELRCESIAPSAAPSSMAIAAPCARYGSVAWTESPRSRSLLLGCIQSLIGGRSINRHRSTSSGRNARSFWTLHNTCQCEVSVRQDLYTYVGFQPVYAFLTSVAEAGALYPTIFLSSGMTINKLKNFSFDTLYLIYV